MHTVICTVNITCFPSLYTYTTQHVLYSLLSEICDDDDGEANDGEYSTNVGHPSEGKY